MVPPSFHKDLHYLNAEERLLRWIVVKHRDVNFSHEYGRNDDFLRDEFTKHPKNTLFRGDDSGDESDDYEEADNEKITEWFIVSLKHGHMVMEQIPLSLCFLHYY